MDVIFLIGRILVGLFDEDGELEVRRVSDDSMPEYYVPAMFQFSNEPGRIERFLQSLFDENTEENIEELPQKFRDDFYLPGANPDDFSERRNRGR
jgi:hypothetical protein